MESIGTLAGGIAHDFNNILGAIIGYAEIALLHELREGNPARHSIQQVVKAGNRAKNLVQQILAFSRQKEQELKIISVTLIVKEAIKLLRATLPATIEIRHKLTAGSDMILADPGQIHQVIMNLCTNAGHVMQEKGGVLEVTLQNVSIEDCGLQIEESEKSEIQSEIRNPQSAIDIAPGSYLKLSVSDTGDGMPPEVLEHIFDPYFTTKAVGKGTGLGLAVVHGIVKSLDGTINVESEQGKGTTFNVFLPTIKSKSEPEIDTHEPVPTGNERILLIDDEETLADAGKQMLEGLGYKVTEKYDLVITDMTMPNMTGDKLARELMKIRPDIPVILCTGFSELINEKKAKSIGIRDFVMKPFAMGEIGIMIRRILDD
jgi:nitrogen-specific signal transduction histidine kinase/CheY-like chemotaxis protein